jgi:hypothetical protein
MSKEPSAAQKMIGDFAPKLAQLTTTFFSAMFGNVRGFPNATAAWQPWQRWLP